MDVLLAMKEAGIIPGVMIDISDGLSSELLHLCKASGIGCQVYDDRIPVAKETREVAGEFSLGTAGGSFTRRGGLRIAFHRSPVRFR